MPSFAAMKRSLAVLAVLSLLVFAAVAVAATPRTGTFKAAKGDIQLGYDFKFTVDKAGKRIKNVVAHVLEDCGEATSTVTTVAPDATWSVKGGKFSGRKKESADGITIYTT